MFIPSSKVPEPHVPYFFPVCASDLLFLAPISDRPSEDKIRAHQFYFLFCLWHQISAITSNYPRLQFQVTKDA